MLIESINVTAHATSEFLIRARGAGILAVQGLRMDSNCKDAATARYRKDGCVAEFGLTIPNSTGNAAGVRMITRLLRAPIEMAIRTKTFKAAYGSGRLAKFVANTADWV